MFSFNFILKTTKVENKGRCQKLSLLVLHVKINRGKLTEISVLSAVILLFVQIVPGTFCGAGNQTFGQHGANFFESFYRFSVSVILNRCAMSLLYTQ